MTPAPDSGIPGWDRARLETGLRACDSRALVSFYSHFRPILHERARLFGIPLADRADAVESFLGDMLLKLCAGTELPKLLHGYVFVSFKRYAARLKAADTVKRDSLEELEQTTSQTGRLSMVSESAQSANASLARFASALLADLSTDDKTIIGAVAEEMPIREIASLLNVNYNAANTRLCRLRSKLRASADEIVARMEPHDAQVVARFLRRANTAATESDAKRSGGGAQRRSTNG